MLAQFREFCQSLSSRLIFFVGLTLLISFSTWAYYNIRYQKQKEIKDISVWTDRLSETIQLGMQYAMMQNSRDDITHSIRNIAKLKPIEHIRIYNKEGVIKFSNLQNEINQKTNIRAEACYICHKTTPPMTDLKLSERVRIIDSAREGHRQLGVITPIRNEPGCSTDSCHIHPPDKKVLGALDVVVSLKESDDEATFFEDAVIAFSSFVFVVTSTIIFFFILRFVRQPIQKLIEGTRKITDGDYQTQMDIAPGNELGQLVASFQKMGKEIGLKQAELNTQRDRYQQLFEQVPCQITVQDRDYRLVQYNREFCERFHPETGDYCYRAYKGRDGKCENCPVEKTFEDGFSHYSEETAINRDGSRNHWLVRTSPIRDGGGNIVAAMEMSVDITRSKELEAKLAASEKKYYAIFNNIPNPVFVLDAATLEILDCNESVKSVYGYTRDEIVSNAFLDLFNEDEREYYAFKLQTASVLHHVRHITRRRAALLVNIRISASEYPGRKVLLITTSDETKRLEQEQQIIQASKMATLGEMATGVAHELNQPLSVIKTASNFFMKKVKRHEPIPDEILLTLSTEIDNHVDRATKIITHMRQFGRKAENTSEKIQVNDILKSAFEIFSQQLKVRGIDVLWKLDEDIPCIMADANRLEQVVINLLLNARDAIDEKYQDRRQLKNMGRITLKTSADTKNVGIVISDTGIGIPPDKLDKIFEPFFTTKKVGKGTGLGLSITYSIVKEYQGDIRAVNNDDGGATFIITFPLAPEDTP